MAKSGAVVVEILLDNSLGLFDALVLRALVGLDLGVALGEVTALGGIEDSEGSHEHPAALFDSLALVVGCLFGQGLVENDRRSLLSLVHLTTQLGDLLVGAPVRRGEALDHGGHVEEDIVDAAVRLATRHRHRHS